MTSPYAAMQPMPGMDAASMCPSQGTMGLFAPYAGGMLAAHALAALAAAWWLRRGEAALFGLVGLLGVVLHGVMAAVRVASVVPAGAVCCMPHVPSAVGAVWLPKWLSFLRYAVARRGPPRMGIAM